MIVQGKGSKLIWGTFLLLSAAFIIANQVGGFVSIGFWTFLVSALSAAFIVQCLFKLDIAPLPIPLAILYAVFRSYFAWPAINLWLLFLAAFLTTAGLYSLLPKRKHRFINVNKNVHINTRSKVGKKRVVVNGNNITVDGEPVVVDGEPVVNGQEKGGRVNKNEGVDYTIDSTDSDNQSISVQFGSVSRYIHSDNLKKINLYCKFGSLEVYFDQAKLSPGGATVFCSNQFGSIELYIPKEWRVNDELDCTFGGKDIEQRREYAQDAPILNIKGNVAFGGVEIHYI